MSLCLLLCVAADLQVLVADETFEIGQPIHCEVALDELDVHAGAACVDPDHPLLLVGQTETSPLFDAESRRALLAFEHGISRQ